MSSRPLTDHLKICRMARIRSSRRSAPAAVAAATRDVDFPHLWRQLRAAGWKAKRPSGLQTEWSYVVPNGSSVFVGESAVIAFALTSGLLNESAADVAAEDESTVNIVNVAAEHGSAADAAGEDQSAADVAAEDESAAVAAAEDESGIEIVVDTSDNDARPS
jgi:hypothetical protein